MRLVPGDQGLGVWGGERTLAQGEKSSRSMKKRASGHFGEHSGRGRRHLGRSEGPEVAINLEEAPQLRVSVLDSEPDSPAYRERLHRWGTPTCKGSASKCQCSAGTPTAQ